MTRPASTTARQVVAVALVGGTVLAVDPAGWFAFAPIKWLVVTTLALVLIALTAWDGAWRRADRRVAVASSVFLGWLAVCAAVGDDPRYAWLGTPERHAGWLLWAMCAALFLCAVPLQAVADGLTIAGAALAPVLLFDAAGHPLVRSGTERLTGTFGSAAYLAAACTLITPVAVGVCLDPVAARWRRTAGGVAAATGMFGIVGSGTRGAWLAVVVVAAPVAWRRRHARGTRVVVVGAAMLVVAAALLTPVGRRVANVGDRDAGGGASRLDEWRVATKVIAQHPLFGAGPEGYRVVFRDGVDAAYERAYGRDPQPDRAHNGILDMAAISGVPGAALSLLLLVTIGMAIRRTIRRRGDPTVIGAAIALAMYVVQQQFLFPLAELEPIAWLLAGALVAPAAIAPSATAAVVAPTPARGRVGRAAAIACGALALGAAWWGARDVLADRAASRAVAAGDQASATTHARAAVGWRGDEVRLQLLLVRATVDPVERRAAFAAAADWSPNDPILLTRHAEFLTATDPTAATTRLRQLLHRDPHNAALHALLGTASARTGDLATAEQEWLAAIALAPTATGPRSNLVTLYRQQGRDAEADEMEKAGNR